MITLQAVRAAERQPDNFDGLQTTVVASEEVSVTRSLACQCGSETGRVLAGGEAANGHLDPLTWTCDRCSKAHVFFDSDRDGYDGRLGNGTAYDQATVLAEIECPECAAKSHKVQCELIYNIDADELDELAESGGGEHLANLFDGLSVNAECALCHRQFQIGSWELA
jgi:DNA-directed RNA polymerase subunit RPC12/RpoP